MKTFFAKIFLWFFIAHIIIGAALYVLALAHVDDIGLQRWRATMTEELRLQGATAALLAENGQLDRLKKLGAPNDISFSQTYIFYCAPNGNLQLVTDGPPPTKAMKDLAESAAVQRNAVWNDTENSSGGALAYPVKGGGAVIVVRHLLGHGPLPWAPDFYSLSLLGFLRPLTILLIIGLVCYSLARHLTAPVASLRDATQQLAKGDFSARVGFAGKRHDELIELGREFDRMATQLEHLVTAERRLLGDISHELRSPLARLSVALDLVEQHETRAAKTGTPVPEAIYQGAITRIRRESARLNEMIGLLLELARLESLASGGQAPLIQDKVALNELITGVVADANYEAENSGRTVQIIENQRCVIHGVAPLLHSAIENIVRNAIRYTPPETSVQVAAKSVDSPQGSGALITVRDYGSGVPEETLPMLFRPFYRVDTGRDRQSGGVGLGLAITDRAVRVHGGTVTARNAEGGGLHVEVFLPC